MTNESISLKNSQALNETANFFRFGFGLGDELYVKQYGQFVADILHADSKIIDDAVAVWSRIQTKFDAEAAVSLHRSENIAEHAKLKSPFVANCFKAVPFSYADYIDKVTEWCCADNIYAIKYMGYQYVRNNEIDNAIPLYRLSSVWGDLFSIRVCEQLCAEKKFWDKLYTIFTQGPLLSDNDFVTKVAKAMKLLRLYDYKQDTIVHDAVSLILSDTSLPDIDMALRTRNLLFCPKENARIGFTTNISTEDQNG